MKGIKFLLVLVLVLVCMPLSACAGQSVYTGPWSGQVIDAESKQPIEGAAVVAIWYKYYATPAGDVGNYLDTAEVVTDKDGKFLLPSKKFLNVPLLRESGAPHFYIFKPGYGSYPEYRVSPKTSTKSLKGFFEKTTVVELPKTKDLKERGNVYTSINGDIQQIHASDFFKIKRTLKLINEEAKYLGYRPRYENFKE